MTLDFAQPIIVVDNILKNESEDMQMSMEILHGIEQSLSKSKEMILSYGQNLTLKYTFSTKSDHIKYNFAKVCIPAGLEIDSGCLADLLNQKAVQDYEQFKNEIGL